MQLIFSDCLLVDDSSLQIIGIYETKSEEFAFWNTKECVGVGVQLLSSLNSLPSIVKTKRSCLLGGFTCTWGFQFNTYPYKGIIRNPWNVPHTTYNQLIISYVDDIIWPAYKRIVPEIAEKYKKEVSSFNTSALLGSNPFTNCSLNVNATLQYHTDKIDWSGMICI